MITIKKNHRQCRCNECGILIEPTIYAIYVNTDTYCTVCGFKELTKIKQDIDNKIDEIMNLNPEDVVIDRLNHV